MGSEPIRFRVYEIEHDGDVEDACEAIQRIGGKVIETSAVNEDSESAIFTVECIGDRAKFFAALRESVIL